MDEHALPAEGPCQGGSGTKGKANISMPRLSEGTHGRIRGRQEGWGIGKEERKEGRIIFHSVLGSRGRSRDLKRNERKLIAYDIFSHLHTVFKAL